jgi:hypothetical protein
MMDDHWAATVYGQESSSPVQQSTPRQSGR